ncbi:MAG: response regulator transcription factor [Chitinophagaceae bacterium]
MRILIADDHAIARRGLKEILLEGFPSAEVETVNNAEELIARIIKESWDVVISDINMPGRSGLDALHQINKEFPKLPVLVLSFHPEEDYAVRVIRAGAAGYLNKDAAIESELINAVNQVVRGRKYITPSIAERLVQELSQDKQKQLHEILSDREFDVFKLLAQGKTTGEIAEKLSLSVNTIGTFRSRILAKMSMRTNADMTAYAIHHHLI